MRFLSVPLFKPKDFPLLSAIAIFSNIVIDGQVPIAGFWYTRPIFSRRLYSFCFVMSFPSTKIFPSSSSMLPQIIFKREVLPEPLLPTIDTNSPFSMVKLKSLNRHISWTVPGL